jgi:predicted phosphodiesterase
MLRIEIIGTIDNQRHYDTETIKELLSLDAEMLMVGRDFVGRPGTRIHACATNVIKIRTELNFNKEQSRRWIKQALEKERQLGVYHPHKTWLLIAVQGESTEPESIAIASICPRLKPLHLELKATPDTNARRQQYLKLLTDVLRMYLTLAKQTNYKLDEGLSNFAVSDEGVVYYLDDEYYQWDKFISFSLMLGVYIRNFDWLDEDFISELGHALVALLEGIFHDDHCRIIIARQLQSLFMPQGQKEQLLHRLMQILTHTDQVQAKSTHPKQVPGRFFALLADVHANYAALDTVLNYLDTHNIHEGIVLGDVVGYNAEPKECIERLQDTDLLIIQGNHDHAVAISETGMGFSNTAKMSIQWTVEQLSPEHRQWLKALPAFIETEDWFAVHGAPIDPAFFYAYVYAMTYESNLQHMQDNKIHLCFHGHSHMPGIFARDKRAMDHCLEGQTISLSPYSQLLVCPGSIGQPRNGCTDTQFAIYDREREEVAFLSLPYDSQSTVQKMRDHDFPETLWKRLLTGK